MKAELIRETDYVMEFTNEYEDFHVSAKWDGCCHIRRYYNGYTYKDEGEEVDVDYIHICELREFIQFLTEIADKCEAKNGFEWS